MYSVDYFMMFGLQSCNALSAWRVLGMQCEGHEFAQVSSSLSRKSLLQMNLPQQSPPERSLIRHAAAVGIVAIVQQQVTHVFAAISVH